jgi:hypothetical protein
VSAKRLLAAIRDWFTGETAASAELSNATRGFSRSWEQSRSWNIMADLPVLLANRIAQVHACAIRTTSAAKENAQGHHYTLKAASRTG